MLKLFMQLIDSEIEKITLLDAQHVSTIVVNDSVNNDALTKLFMANPPGTELLVSSLPYTQIKLIQVIAADGKVYTFSDTIVEENFKNSYADDISDLMNKVYRKIPATLSAPETIVHSKYIWDGNSIEPNPLYIQPFITVPNLGQKNNF